MGTKILWVRATVPTESTPLAMTEIVSGTWPRTWQTPLSDTIKSFFATYAKDPAIRQQAMQDISYSQMAETVKISSIARTMTSGVGTTLDWARVQEELFRRYEVGNR